MESLGRENKCEVWKIHRRRETGRGRFNVIEKLAPIPKLQPLAPRTYSHLHILSSECRGDGFMWPRSAISINIYYEIMKWTKFISRGAGAKIIFRRRPNIIYSVATHRIAGIIAKVLIVPDVIWLSELL